MKRAFTLAEVLITLTIIGVIAAITIPNLMQSWKKHQVEAGIKEAYSIVSNTLKIALVNEGMTFEELWQDSHDYGHGTGDWVKASDYIGERFIYPYIRHTDNICKDGVASAKCPFGPNNYACTINGVCDSSATYHHVAQLQRGYKIELNNGMYLKVLYDQGPNSDYFIVDINGRKGPNRWGYDIFSFEVKPNAKGLTAGLGSRSSYDQCVQYGYGCSAIIAKNGWKIPDDYPVKKW